MVEVHLKGFRSMYVGSTNIDSLKFIEMTYDPVYKNYTKRFSCDLYGSISYSL